MKLRVLLSSALILTAMQVEARTMADIQQAGTLKVGVPGDYAPLAYHDADGKLVGYDVDMAKALAKDLKLNVEFVLTSWPSLSSDLAADKFDVAMGGVTATAKREAEFGLTKPIVPNGKIALAGCAVAGSLGDLEKLTNPASKSWLTRAAPTKASLMETLKKRRLSALKTTTITYRRCAIAPLT